MFEKFTRPARLVVGDAVEIAQDLGHRQFGSDHMLLALVSEAEPVTSRALSDAGVTADRVKAAVVARRGAESSGDDEEALRTLGIDLAAVREKVEAAFGAGALDRRRDGDHPRRGDRARVSPDGRKTLQLSLREAVRKKDRYIGTEHILLGILRTEGDGYDVLRSLDVDVAALRRSIETGNAA